MILSRLISMTGELEGGVPYWLGPGGRPWPPDPREPVPSVPPSDKPTGPPSTTGASGRPPAPSRITRTEMLAVFLSELTERAVWGYSFS
jgi:hypothetical protein